MGSLWIEADEVPVEALPDWAKTALPEHGIALAREGIVVRERRGRASAATWGRVFGVVLCEAGPTPDGPLLALEERLLVLVPREPPAPPWLALVGHDLPASIDGLAALSSALRQRVAQGGAYRGREPGAPRLGAAELLERARALAGIPGAVQVPIRSQSPSIFDVRWARTLIMGGSGGAMSAYFAAAVMQGPFIVPVAVGAGIAGALFSGLGSELSIWLERRERARNPRRVLLLAPDGCICGFIEGVAAFTWDEIGEFRKESTPKGPALAVRDREGKLRGTIDARWFSEPLSLIVDVAEAYRKRAAG